MIDEVRVRMRIAQLEQASQQITAVAKEKLAQIDGAISELKALLVVPEPTSEEKGDAD